MGEILDCCEEGQLSGIFEASVIVPKRSFNYENKNESKLSFRKNLKTEQSNTKEYLSNKINMSFHSACNGKTDSYKTQTLKAKECYEKEIENINVTKNKLLKSVQNLENLNKSLMIEKSELKNENNRLIKEIKEYKEQINELKDKIKNSKKSKKNEQQNIKLQFVFKKKNQKIENLDLYETKYPTIGFLYEMFIEVKNRVLEQLKINSKIIKHCYFNDKEINQWDTLEEMGIINDSFIICELG